MTATTPPGRVLRDAHGTRLEFIRTYDAPVEEVWSALTERERVAGWLGEWTGDPASGTVDLLMTAEEGHTPEPLTIVECEPPTRLTVELPSPGDPWRVSVSLSEDDGMTTLVFTQPLAEPSDATIIGPGWHYYLDRLGAVVADTAVPESWDDDYFPALKAAYALPD